jgi:hypothetical protein
MFVLGMAFIDLFIGCFVLPMRFVSAYGSPLTPKLCAALSIGESCAIAAVIYAILFMIYTRIYSLKHPLVVIHRRYLILLLLSSWTILFLFYGIPFMTNYSSYLVTIASATSNSTSYCTTYTSSIYHPPWMAYTEIGIIYSLPLIFIFCGVIYLIYNLCQRQPRRLELGERKIYYKQRQMTWHVFILSITFIILWLPWISVRILIIFDNIPKIQTALQITYYILILKCVLFPVLYASTNESFRGSFAIYRHQRITMNNRVWTINGGYGPTLHKIQQRRGY